MRYIKLLVASVILVSMSACVADNESELDKLGYIKTINVIGPGEIAFEQISGAGQTKATAVDAGSALVFRWAAGDTLGIFPNKGNQVEFPITTQESSTSASFDGGGWALRNNASYAAYYPFSVWNYFQDNKTVIMDYSGQVQDGNGSFAHLSAYDYLASAKTTPENGSVTFQMDRQGSILYIDIVVPEPATITSLTISCDEAIFVEKAALDISGDTPEVTPIETKESLTLNFENTATTEQNETVRAYMAVQPLDFSSKTVTATLVTDAGTYTAPVVSRVVNKGKAAFLRFSDSFTNNTIPGTAVDLGLPSGLKWATCNIGASSPEEYGDYFAWGETEPYYSSQDPLTWKDGKSAGYDWASYQWFNGSGTTMTKYCTSSSYGTVDNKTVLDPEDDAARAKWGGSWRMPTFDDWTELRTKCTWTWTTRNGVNGRLVTGPNGNSIFLPAAGHRYSTDLYDTGSSGSYWSSSLNTGLPYRAYVLYFNSDDVSRVNYNRCLGQSVRPVTDEGVHVSVTNVSLDNDSLNLTIDETATLTATVTPSNATQSAVVWSSSDTSVATVSWEGVVTAVSAGTAIITVTTNDGGFTATCEVTVNAEPVIPDEGDYINLSVSETANCYFVSMAGAYSFDASVMGNGPDGYIWEDTQGQDMHLWPYHQEDVYFEAGDVQPSKAFVIWDDNDVITEVVYNANTKRISFVATGNKGNALIGLFDKYSTEAGVMASTDEALWSWHIWCTDTPQIFIMYDDNDYGYEILDRNLGATSANPADGVATYGFFYQFGRKDPIKGYDGIAGDQKKARQELKYSVNHPTLFFKLNTETREWFNDGNSSLATVCADLWGNPAWKFASTANIHPYQALRSELQKTIYDPCPPGYMVPPETAWTGIDEESISLVENGVIIPTASGDSFYPFSGYISDLNSWEDDSMGYYAYNGCTITLREKRTARVYSSYTGLHSEWAYDDAPNHNGGCSLSVHINDGDPITTDYLEFDPMYQSNRQRGHNVRCVREFNE